MKTISLEKFIRTGRFRTITIGSSKQEVIDLFGSKYDFGDFGESQIIKYGWYEFFYWTATEKIYAIQNDHLQADCGNHLSMITFKSKGWRLNKWFLQKHKNVTRQEVKEALTSKNIPFVEEIVKPFDEKIIRCLQSNVTFDFADEYRVIEWDANGKIIGSIVVKETNEEKYVLNGIRLFYIG